jgi:hypothetical protein
MCRQVRAIQKPATKVNKGNTERMENVWPILLQSQRPCIQYTACPFPFINVGGWRNEATLVYIS